MNQDTQKPMPKYPKEVFDRMNDNKERNAAFANFLRWEKDAANSATNQTRNDKWLNPKNGIWTSAFHMKFHDDWNWFMKVFVKMGKAINDSEKSNSDYIHTEDAILNADLDSACMCAYNFISEL